MGKAASHLRLVSNASPEFQRPVCAIAVIVSITQIEIVVPWYLRPIASRITNLYLLTIQEFSDEYRHPWEVQTWTCQCNSLAELRACILSEKNRMRGRGRVAVVDLSNTCGELVLEFNQS